MIANCYEAALRIVAIDAACGVGDDHCLDAHAGENANGEGDFLSGIAFVEVDAALHTGDGDVANIADDEAPGVADGGGLGKVWNFSVGDFRSVAEFVGEIAEPGAQDQSD